MKETVRFGGDQHTTTLDLVLATAIALGLPFACRWLFQTTGGAAASLLVYYGVCCIAIVRWRKGTLDYHRPQRWPWLLLSLSALVPLAIAAINWGALPRSDAATGGFIVTLLFWAPLNAALEQLSWLYVLDAWRNRWRTAPVQWIGLTIGVILLLVLIGLIHALFWALFLPTAGTSRFSAFSIPLNFMLTFTYVALYYRSRSMWPVFMIHLLADLQLVLLASYSILPDL